MSLRTAPQLALRAMAHGGASDRAISGGAASDHAGVAAVHGGASDHDIDDNNAEEI